MNTSRFNRSLSIFNISIAVVLVLALFQVAPSMAIGESTKVQACANKKTGALRLATKKCTSKEKAVSWNAAGTAGAVGSPGPTGPSGPAGIAIGLYAADMSSNPAAITDCSGSPCTTILMRAGAVSGSGVSSATSLVLPEAKWIQATATVDLTTASAIEADAGSVSCNVKSGVAGTNPSTWTAFGYSTVTLNELDFDKPIRQTMTIVGSKQLEAGSYDFLIDCLQHSDVVNSVFKSSKQTLNVIAVN